jgi:hypothetical protein
MSNVMSKHSRSFFSDSSSDSEGATKSAAVISRQKSQVHDLSTVQPLGTICEGEKCIEVLVEFMSMSQKLIGQGKVVVSALVSGKTMLF